MITGHPTESVLQQYALDKAGCEPGIAAHIEACASCRAKAASYRMLFAEIKQQPKPAFDFDLTAMVMPQLAAARPRASRPVFFFYAISVLVAGATGVMVYLSRKWLLSAFAGMMPVVLYLIVLTTIAILLFQCMGMYKKYQKQLQRLNSL